jgi:hypothetical protein
MPAPLPMPFTAIRPPTDRLARFGSALVPHTQNRIPGVRAFTMYDAASAAPASTPVTDTLLQPSVMAQEKGTETETPVSSQTWFRRSSVSQVTYMNTVPTFRTLVTVVHCTGGGGGEGGGGGGEGGGGGGEGGSGGGRHRSVGSTNLRGVGRRGKGLASTVHAGVGEEGAGGKVTGKALKRVFR